MNHGSLFSGIGGFDLAASWMGWRNVFHCEINPFARKVLKYYWPKTKSYEDIKKTDFSIWEGEIDILTGGFPCQPFSVAGLRKGDEDDRYLWPEMLRAVRECHPAWIVAENVPGIINWSGGMVFEEVWSDLEDEGYKVQPVVLPAAGVGAPHRRDRVWIIAHCADARVEGVRTGREDETHGCEIVADADEFNGDLSGFRTGEISQFEKARVWQHSPADANGKRLERIENKKEVEYTTYRDDWSEFPTQPPICSGDDGFPGPMDGITFSAWRNESIKGFGNAIVPEIAFIIFKEIEKLFEI